MAGVLSAVIITLTILQTVLLGKRITCIWTKRKETRLYLQVESVAELFGSINKTEGQRDGFT